MKTVFDYKYLNKMEIDRIWGSQNKNVFKNNN